MVKTGLRPSEAGKTDLKKKKLFIHVFSTFLVKTHENMSQCDRDNFLFNIGPILVLGIPLTMQQLFSFARIIPLNYRDYKQGFTGS